MRLVLVLIGLLAVNISFGQQLEVDSLMHIMKEKPPRDTTFNKVLNEMAYQYSYLNKDSTTKYAWMGLRLARELHFEHGEARALRLVGISWYFKSEYDSALKYFQQSLDLANRVHDPLIAGRAINNIGLVYDYRGDYTRALDYYQQSLRIREQLKDSLGMANSLNNIGIVYEYEKDYRKALEYHFKTLEIRKQLHNLGGMASSYGNIANNYAFLEAYDTASHYYEISNALFEAEGDSSSIALNLNSMGNALNRQGKFRNAVALLRKAIRIHEMEDSPIFICQDLLILSKSYLGMGNLSLAERHAVRGMSIARQLRAKAELRDLSLLLSQIYEAENQPGQALQYLNLHLQYKDSVSNDESNVNMGRLEAKYEYDKALLTKELEYNQQQSQLQQKTSHQRFILYAALLALAFALMLTLIIYRSFNRQKRITAIVEAKNSEIEKQKKEIETSNDKLNQFNSELTHQSVRLEELNETKDKLFSIISHDLRGPVNSLKGMLDLVVKHNLSKEEFQQFSSQLMNGVEHVQFTLNNLLQWASGQLHGIKTQPTTFDLFTATEENTNLLLEQARSKHIEMVNEVDRKCFAFADRDQITLVIRNLLSNAIKFTATGGHIRIQSAVNDDEITITIKDDGIGMTREFIEHLFSQKSNQTKRGTEGEKGTGLGLQLSAEMVRANHGRIEIESEPGVGSSIQIYLPQAPPASPHPAD